MLQSFPLHISTQVLNKLDDDDDDDDSHSGYARYSVWAVHEALSYIITNIAFASWSEGLAMACSLIHIHMDQIGYMDIDMDMDMDMD